ncbi:ERBB receptor feedback inhibitor 1a [Erpetoichthys calabaricus]|uniref:ERBB receptor feedback inhibitor 1a n=1 Tax=Erpetoichthys calabaricus TaxID=27687 RepID=A0A8C4RZ58_ERPCA|nr:ERBB receptor feedback inhibitor 1a [Erpetoichthys calabaricus]XP_028663236.1 ERBB receptor feedback inhibitor 1a [Erpetoichthys calabaricus]
MSTAGVAAQDVRNSLKSGFQQEDHPYWGSHGGFENLYLSLDTTSMAYNLKSHQQHPVSVGFERPSSHKELFQGLCCFTSGQRLPPKKSRPSQLNFSGESFVHSILESDQVVPSFSKLSVNGGVFHERTPPHTPIRAGPACGLFMEKTVKPLPPLPVPGNGGDISPDAVDSEVEFFTSTDSSSLVTDSCYKPLAFRYGAPSRRSFRGCGQINYAYFDGPTGSQIDEDCTPPSTSCTFQTEEIKSVSQTGSTHSQPERPHRRLRRSHSGPAGSFNKQTLRIGCQKTSPQQSDGDKPVVPPRVPIPPRPLKGDIRRWSAEVTSNMYSDDDKPPKVPPREPRCQGDSRTPSPKSLPSYLNGVMPPTQSFAPDPKYMSAKALQRQNSEGSQTHYPCILPIIEGGKKASTTHYYLLPERPVCLDSDE